MRVREFLSEHSRGLFVLSLLALLIIVAFFPYHNFSNQYSDEKGKVLVENKKVAILDQFYEEKPDFTENAIGLFGDENIGIDVYENITVNLYRELPTLGYKVIIIRVHSASGYRTEEGVNWDTGLFTTEKYNSSKYPILQTKELIGGATPTGDDEEKMFAIKSKFIVNEMRGKFDNTLLILDTCRVFNPKTNFKLTKKFYEKGVDAVVGWSEPVTLNHGDKGTLRFLEKILSENMTLKKAVEEVYEEVGTDPEHGAKLIIPYKSSKLKLKKNEGRLILEK